MEKSKLVQVDNTTKLELLEDFKNVIENELKEFKAELKPHQRTQLLNRKQTAEYFSVSVVTIDSWERKKIIFGNRIGNRKYYKLHELEDALTKINK